MIIPVQPVPVRISLETQAINNGGYVTTDIDIEKMIRDAESVQYELNLCYGSTSLYRSSVYHVNKYLNTITFFFMVGSDIYSATLSVSNKRCTFAKIETGVSEGTVNSIVSNAIYTLMSTGYAENLTNVNYSEGFSITTPGSDTTGLIASGHILIVEGDDTTFTSYDKFVSTDFWYGGASKGWQFKDPIAGSAFSATDITISGTKTAVHIVDRYFTNFNVYVIWYCNPDGCTIEEGDVSPNSQGL